MTSRIFCLTKDSESPIFNLPTSEHLRAEMFNMFAEQHATFMKKYPIVIDFQENWSATLVEEQCFKIDNFIEINKIASAIHEPIGYQAINVIDEIKAIFTGIKDGVYYYFYTRI